jgi:hypothetical protein
MFANWHHILCLVLWIFCTHMAILSWRDLVKQGDRWEPAYGLGRTDAILEDPLGGMCQPNQELSRCKKISTVRYCPDCDTDLSQTAESVQIPHRHSQKPWKIGIKWYFQGMLDLINLGPPTKIVQTLAQTSLRGSKLSGLWHIHVRIFDLKLSRSAQTSAPKVKILSRPWLIVGFRGSSFWHGK